MNAKPSYFAWQRAINDAGVFLDGWCADAAEMERSAGELFEVPHDGRPGDLFDGRPEST